MDKRRDLRLSKYDISAHRYAELKSFCLQYPEWVERVRDINFLQGQCLNGMPFLPEGHNSDSTGDDAIRLAELKEKIELVDSVLEQAGGDLEEYLRSSVCEGNPMWYIRDIMEMPCAKDTFYDMRRHFFYLLDRAKR